MKKIKTILSVLLAVLMLFSMMVPMASAAEYSDVPATHKYYKAITDLSVYGILNGFEDGTFRPEETVTRAQFAKIICYALNIGDLAGGAVDTGFTDVDPNHWAAGNIKMAASMGIINGMGDGTFQPESPVLYEQAVKMVVCALGYSKAAEDNGGYFYGHMTVAANIGILKASDGVVGAGANRGTIANLVNNMLDAEQVTSTGEKGESLKEQQIKTVALDGQVTAVYGSTIYANTVSPCSRYQIQLLAADGQHYTYSVSELDSVKNSVSDYLGRRVTVYYSAEDELRSPLLTNITLQANKNHITEVDLADITDFSNTEVEYMADYTFGDTETVSVSSYANILYNGVATSTNLSALIDPTKSGQITFLDSDNDTDADVVFIKEYTTMIVKSKATNTYKLYDEDVLTGTKNDLVLDPTDSTKSITIKKNGASAEFKDISQGDVVSFAKSIDGNIIDVLVSNKTASNASISAYNASRDLITLRVSGKDTEYKLSEDFDKYTDAVLEVGLSGKFFIDAFGKIVKVDITSDSSYTYAYLTGFENSGSATTPSYAVQLIAIDGKTTVAEKIIELAAKFKIDGNQFTDTSSQASIESALTSAAITFNNSSAFAGDDETKYCQVIKYSTNAAGKVDRIITANYAVDLANKINIDNTYLDSGAVCTVKGSKLEKVFSVNNAKILFVPETRKEDATNKFRGYTASALFKKDTSYKVQLIDTTDAYVVPYIIMYGSAAEATATTWADIAPSIVKDVKDEFYNGVATTCITVLTSAAEEVKYYKSENTISNVSTIAIGDVIRVDADGENYIEDFKLVVTLADMIAANDPADWEKAEGDGSGTTRQYRRIIGTAVMTSGTTLMLTKDFVESVTNGDEVTYNLDQSTRESFEAKDAKIIYVDSAKVSQGTSSAITESDFGEIVGFENQPENASKILLYSKSGSVKLIVIFK